MKKTCYILLVLTAVLTLCGCGIHKIDDPATAEKFTKLTTIATTVGFSNECIHIYAAQGLVSGTQCPDEDEFIHTVRVPLEEAVEMVGDGRIYDAKSIAAILLLAQHVNRE